MPGYPYPPEKPRDEDAQQVGPDHATETSHRSMFDMTECCYGWDGEATIYDGRHHTKAAAITKYLELVGEQGDAKIVADSRYGRWMTEVEVWQRSTAFENWAEWRVEHADGFDFELPESRPDAPPKTWEPWEEDPCWQFCDVHDDGAVQIWVVQYEGSIDLPAIARVDRD